MEKQTQQREGRSSTRSLLHRRVTPKSDTSPGEKQAPEQEIERFLRIFDLFKPRVVSTTLVIVAICDYIHNLDVFRFLVLMGAAAGYISPREAINLLLGKSVNSPPLLEGGDADGRPGEEASDDQQNEST
jgi:hypothetical protein